MPSPNLNQGLTHHLLRGGLQGHTQDFDLSHGTLSSDQDTLSNNADADTSFAEHGSTKHRDAILRPKPRRLQAPVRKRPQVIQEAKATTQRPAPIIDSANLVAPKATLEVFQPAPSVAHVVREVAVGQPVVALVANDQSGRRFLFNVPRPVKQIAATVAATVITSALGVVHAAPVDSTPTELINGGVDWSYDWMPFVDANWAAVQGTAGAVAVAALVAFTIVGLKAKNKYFPKTDETKPLKVPFFKRLLTSGRILLTADALKNILAAREHVDKVLNLEPIAADGEDGDLADLAAQTSPAHLIAETPFGLALYKEPLVVATVRSDSFVPLEKLANASLINELQARYAKVFSTEVENNRDEKALAALRIQVKIGELAMQFMRLNELKHNAEIKGLSDGAKADIRTRLEAIKTGLNRLEEMTSAFNSDSEGGEESTGEEGEGAGAAAIKATEAEEETSKADAEVIELKKRMGHVESFIATLEAELTAPAPVPEVPADPPPRITPPLRLEVPDPAEPVAYDLPITPVGVTVDDDAPDEELELVAPPVDLDLGTEEEEDVTSPGVRLEDLDSEDLDSAAVEPAEAPADIADEPAAEALDLEAARTAPLEDAVEEDFEPIAPPALELGEAEDEPAAEGLDLDAVRTAPLEDAVEEDVEPIAPPAFELGDEEDADAEELPFALPDAAPDDEATEPGVRLSAVMAEAEEAPAGFPVLDREEPMPTVPEPELVAPAEVAPVAPADESAPVFTVPTTIVHNGEWKEYTMTEVDPETSYRSDTGYKVGGKTEFTGAELLKRGISLVFIPKDVTLTESWPIFVGRSSGTLLREGQKIVGVLKGLEINDLDGNHGAYYLPVENGTLVSLTLDEASLVFELQDGQLIPHGHSVAAPKESSYTQSGSVKPNPIRDADGIIIGQLINGRIYWQGTHAFDGDPVSFRLVAELQDAKKAAKREPQPLPHVADELVPEDPGAVLRRALRMADSMEVPADVAKPVAGPAPAAPVSRLDSAEAREANQGTYATLKLEILSAAERTDLSSARIAELAARWETELEGVIPSLDDSITYPYATLIQSEINTIVATSSRNTHKIRTAWNRLKFLVNFDSQQTSFNLAEARDKLNYTRVKGFTTILFDLADECDRLFSREESSRFKPDLIFKRNKARRLLNNELKTMIDDINHRAGNPNADFVALARELAQIKNLVNRFGNGELKAHFSDVNAYINEQNQPKPSPAPLAVSDGSRWPSSLPATPIRPAEPKVAVEAPVVHRPAPTPAPSRAERLAAEDAATPYIQPVQTLYQMTGGQIADGTTVVFNVLDSARQVGQHYQFYFNRDNAQITRLIEGVIHKAYPGGEVINGKGLVSQDDPKFTEKLWAGAAKLLGADDNSEFYDDESRAYWVDHFNKNEPAVHIYRVFMQVVKEAFQGNGFFAQFKAQYGIDSSFRIQNKHHAVFLAQILMQTLGVDTKIEYRVGGRGPVLVLRDKYGKIVGSFNPFADAERPGLNGFKLHDLPTLDYQPVKDHPALEIRRGR